MSNNRVPPGNKKNQIIQPMKAYFAKQVSIIPENTNNIKRFPEYSINLSSNININESSYLKSDLLTFLTVLCEKNLINNVRIVCHSAIMKTFAKIIDKNNEYLKAVFEKNLWTLFLKNENNKNFNISISRHAFTFANLLKEKGSLIGQVLETDTQLSLYGILTALMHGNTLVKNEKNSGLTINPDLVYVSVLIRTWMTSICLYLPHHTNSANSTNNKNSRNITNNKNSKNKTFTLVISPFIKEEGRSYDNTPKKFDIQISNIIKFLHYLYNLNVDNLEIKKIKNFFDKEGEIIINKLEEKYTIKLENIKALKSSNSTNHLNTAKLKNKSTNHFNGTSNNCTKLYFKDVYVFDGIDKLNPTKTTTSRWCEPFAMQRKVMGFGVGTCSS